MSLKVLINVVTKHDLFFSNENIAYVVVKVKFVMVCDFSLLGYETLAHETFALDERKGFDKSDLCSFPKACQWETNFFLENIEQCNSSLK